MQYVSESQNSAKYFPYKNLIMSVQIHVAMDGYRVGSKQYEEKRTVIRVCIILKSLSLHLYYDYF